MGRATRTFKLRLSPAGMDVLIDSHCHLIRSTRTLIAWGTTLHVAVHYLDTIPSARLITSLRSLREMEWEGAEEHHVGAPHSLSEIATGIADRLRAACAGDEPLLLANIYLMALDNLRRAEPKDLLETFARIKPDRLRMEQ